MNVFGFLRTGADAGPAKNTQLWHHLGLTIVNANGFDIAMANATVTIAATGRVGDNDRFVHVGPSFLYEGVAGDSSVVRGVSLVLTRGMTSL